MRARGQHRFGDGAKPNDLTITRKTGEWFASVTLRVSEHACARARTGDAHRGVDFGLNDWATFDNGETIANPRFVRNEMPRMADLRQAKKKRGSIRYKRLGKQVAKAHERIGNLRREFLRLCPRRSCNGCMSVRMRPLRTTRPECSVGRPDRCAYAWNGRSGETQTSGAVTPEGKIRGLRHPCYSVARYSAAGQSINARAWQRRAPE